MKLRIEKAIYGGAGLARISVEPGQAVIDAGKTVFVPMTIPGELVEATITEDHKAFANAELESIIEAAPTRTTPPCPYYGQCGGCQYQHATYAQQLEMKTAILRETLERAGVLNKARAASTAAAPHINILSSPDEGQSWNYRNRIRLHIRPATANEPPTLCYRQRASHALLPVNDCPIAAPVLVGALQGMQRLAGSHQLDQLWEEVEFFTNPQQDSVLITLTTSETSPVPFASDPTSKLASLCTSLQAQLPALRGAAVFSTTQSPALNRTSQTTPTRTRNTIATWGEQHLIYPAANFDYRVSLGSFFQTNRYLVDPLVDLVTADQSGDLAWDLYAGVGLFCRALTRSFRQVRAVESAPTSCADLRHNLQGTTHKIVESTTLDFLRLQAQSGIKKSHTPDLAVVDPPRAGLGAEVTTLLARIAPREIVYVSCDPATLARDLSALLQSGYRLQSVTLVDLFPQTFHIESVSRLSLR